MDGGFYECHNEKTKHMRMMNLGRTTAGKQHKLAIPPLYLEHALEASKLAHAAFPLVLSNRTAGLARGRWGGAGAGGAGGAAGNGGANAPETSAFDEIVDANDFYDLGDEVSIFALFEHVGLV